MPRPDAALSLAQKPLLARQPAEDYQRLLPHLRNRILAALPREEYERMAPNLKTVSLLLGSILYIPDETIQHVYFPKTCVISILAALEDGATVEAGVTGSEGMVGVPIVLGADSTPNQALTQVAGDAWQMPAENLREEFRRGGKLHDLLLRYTHTLFTQVAQTAACNRVHRIDERLARWLLITHDRVRSDCFILTQEFLARMLGVHRPGVTEAAVALREKNLINYSRGKITVLDRPGLEDASCECYRIVKEEYDRYLNM
nr:Transcription regulator, crp [uncultured bacterium]